MHGWHQNMARTPVWLLAWLVSLTRFDVLCTSSDYICTAKWNLFVLQCLLLLLLLFTFFDSWRDLCIYTSIGTPRPFKTWGLHCLSQINYIILPGIVTLYIEIIPSLKARKELLVWSRLALITHGFILCGKSEPESLEQTFLNKLTEIYSELYRLIFTWKVFPSTMKYCGNKQ